MSKLGTVLIVDDEDELRSILTEILGVHFEVVASIGEGSGDVMASAPGVPAGAKVRMGTGRKLKNLAMFTRQLAVLVASGTALVVVGSSTTKRAPVGCTGSNQILP